MLAAEIPVPPSCPADSRAVHHSYRVLDVEKKGLHEASAISGGPGARLGAHRPCEAQASRRVEEHATTSCRYATK